MQNVKKVPRRPLGTTHVKPSHWKRSKFEPMDTKDFAPFKDYGKLSIKISEAYEAFYNAPSGSCDILLSNQGPSRYKMKQNKSKKFVI